MTSTNGKKLYTVWQVRGSYKKTTKFIEENVERYTLSEKIKLLEIDNSYHDRLHKNTNYKFFGDCDYYRKSFDDFSNLLIEFLKKDYDIDVTKNDIMYTQNKNKIGSFHYVIPKYWTTTEKIKEIHEHFRQKYVDEFIYTEGAETHKVVDTGIYTEKWFRCPNQSKKGDATVKHIIIKGEMKDFIFDNIEDTSQCITDKVFLGNVPIKEKNSKKQKVNIIKEKKKAKLNIDEDDKEDEIINNDHIMNTVIQKKEWPILYNFFDTCYKQIRFDSYDDWVNVGMGIKNRYGDDGFILFKYFSKKGNDPASNDELLKKYSSFNLSLKNKITLATLYHYARIDNEYKYTKIIQKMTPEETIDMSSVGIAKYIKMLKPNDFLYKNKELYCYNGTLWVKNDSVPLLSYISEELYEFMYDICSPYLENKKLRAKLDKLKDLRFKNEIVETCREYLTNEDIEFDSKWYLFGFTNKVLDLLTLEFRDYRFDDYMIMNTGYKWIDPIDEEYNTVKNLLHMIQPDKKEYDLWLEIYGTALEGRCLEKFIMYTGCGRNGKGFTNDLALKTFGNYSTLINCAVLFETQKSGAQQELAVINKKRFGLFREPPATREIENSIVKNLTGGGDFTARALYSTETQVKNHLTTGLECNKKSKFKDEFMNAEVDRLIILDYGSTFVMLDKDVDIAKRKYLANVEFKTDDWILNHRCAFIKIILDAYKGYKERGYKFDIPKIVMERTHSYMAMSSNIYTWIKDNYIKTENEKDITPINDIYEPFTKSGYYNGLSAVEKRIFNKSYFTNEIFSNMFLKNYAKERIKVNKKDYRNVLTYYRPKFDGDGDDNDDNSDDNSV
jgi:ribosomal protein S8E